MSAKKALLIIDMLNDFAMNGSLPVKDMEKVLPKIEDIINSIRKKRYWNIIYLNDSHIENDPEFKYWPRHAVKGTYGAEVIDRLKPSHLDKVIEKKTYNGFYQTNLEKLLKNLGIKKLFFTGVLTDICVYNTLINAFERGYECFLVSDATATTILPEEEKYWKLSEEKQKFWIDNIRIKKLAEIVDSELIKDVE
ncbi:MAG: cysteine hydrolase [Candidatus Parvarchaeota archaeon]|nr:cysteine hydrolase [Candidatus Jingweiarchaeum tengchongense]MCW1298342.1 cysteine hydrolase [Candidatus Jingweiarchaeum tengchongense]MCW1300690.1 cysteine hydrolase [Candidatus Jingweiarchaeum tengchongense]MCW1304721.1 cysteine hydrolase [Candidatus Jingweiarchaeum tengchongense]MCW1309491.1 cysteine hydrolase [Candidatus Jingweiarchaeum tengchongense]